MINTKFWSDNYISDLDPSEKLLFLYLITNPFTNICGIYEITVKQIALDTGFDKEMIFKIFERFKKDEKIHYFDGWVWVKNFSKHQKSSGAVKLGVRNGLKEVPREILAQIKQILHEGGTQGTHSLKLELESELEFEFEPHPLDNEEKVFSNKKVDLKKIADVLPSVQLGGEGIAPDAQKCHTPRQFLNRERARVGLPAMKTKLSEKQEYVVLRLHLIDFFKEAVNERHSKTYFTDPEDLKREMEAEDEKVRGQTQAFFKRCGGNYEKAKEVIEWFAKEEKNSYCNWSPQGCFRPDTVVQFENAPKEPKRFYAN